ncbi:MAG: GspE/PulE family protein [Pyramidobacter sp.]|nr:GspE/PulE family protein [Pyramidobacter sp.]
MGESIEKNFNNNGGSLSASFRLSPSKEALKLVPYSAAVRLMMLPLEVTPQGRLKVAAVRTDDLPAADEVKALSGLPVDIFHADAETLTREIERAYNFHGLIEQLTSRYAEAASPEKETPEDLSDSAPVVQIVKSLFQQAVAERCSDIHIEPTEKDSRVRFRIDGRLAEAVTFPGKLHAAVSARIKILSNIDIAEKRLPQDGRILSQVCGRKIDFRVSTLPSVHGEKIVIRILDRQQTVRGLEGLGCDAEGLESIESLLRLKSGIILAAGPTGSGKTTTLYAMLARLNAAEFNIVTVEDPVEYEISGTTQVQINEKGGLTFASVLRSILRQDPDIIMVGEIRDSETASLAVRAALTGHLVVSSLHTNDAASSAIRLVDMGVPPFLAASALKGVVAQRLVRKLCPHCKEPYTLSDSQCARLGVPEKSTFWRPVGCSKCSGRGYYGRTALFEILKISSSFSEAVQGRGSADTLRCEAERSGMKSLSVCGVEKALAGVTSLEEVWEVVSAKEDKR